MEPTVSYRLAGPVATVTLDDGTVNVLSTAVLGELNAALDQAAADRAVVLLSGRPGIFSAGFDLRVLRARGAGSAAMVRAGFALSERLLSFPTPVVIACTGHAVAMGVFLVLSGDFRVGAAGPYKLTANEVAIGVTMPRAAIEILRQRLTPAHFNRAALLAEPFSPDNAVEAGFLDRVVSAADLHDAARSAALAIASLDPDAHLAAKLRARRNTLSAIRAAIDADNAEFGARV